MTFDSQIIMPYFSMFLAVDADDYAAADKNQHSGTALCELFQHEIPSVVHWAKTIPGKH